MMPVNTENIIQWTFDCGAAHHWYCTFHDRGKQSDCDF